MRKRNSNPSFNSDRSKTNRVIAGMEIEDYVLTATEKEAAKMERPLDKHWLGKMWIVVALAMMFLLGRVLYVNVIKGAYYQTIANGNSVRSLVINAPRGRMFDRFGNVLVNNIPSMDVVAIPADLPQASDAKEVIAQVLAGVLNVNEADIWGKLETIKATSLDPILIKENISQDESLILAEDLQKLPGIYINKTAIRDYVDAATFSDILGYEGKITQAELDANK